MSGEWVHGLYMADYGRQPIDDVFVMDAAMRYRHTSAERGVTLEPYLFLRNFLDRAMPTSRTTPCRASTSSSA